MGLCGTNKEHCCWFAGKECQYVQKSSNPNSIWACKLRAESGSWEEAHNKPEYLANVKPQWAAIGYPDRNCGDWPLAGMKCNDCGEIG